MDSYQKMVVDMFGKHFAQSKMFQYVDSKDLDEVSVAFALATCKLDYADNFRIFPLHMIEEFYSVANKGCCGSFNSQIKCLSNNIYWIGCNYGH